ncbi:MAG: S8/S53 family peptidase [Flavobacteriaceae bacterium]
MKLNVFHIFLLIVFFQTPFYSALAQNPEYWFYITAKEESFNPPFQKKNNVLQYSGLNQDLQKILANYDIYSFKKTYRNAKKEDLQKTFFVRCNKGSLLQELLEELPQIFIKGQEIPIEEQKIFEPNDYGLTSTVGENLGFQVNLDYYDFLNLPKAWYYTTGTKNTIVGISDGAVDSTNIEFKGKTKVYRKAPFSNGHGVSQAATAVAQGNNAYGFPGVCYDCGLFTTNYGYYQDFNQLIELSNEGARVINCSWIGRKYFETAQKAIDSMYAKGTLIVASAGNDDWIKGNKGELKYYPASYDKVISVSSGMYKYEKPEDNILYMKESNQPYVVNIRGYVGRTAGFKDNKVENGIQFAYAQSVAVLNKEVDILAPTVDIFSYAGYLLNNNTIKYNQFETTSGASPFVSGTIGLMFSLYPCLPVDEVESILKMTSWNIDHIEANAPYRGMYGAGMLQTGDAVEMVFQLYNENETAYIDHQNFSRWDFKITSLSKEIIIQNQKFTDSATLKLTAKNSIVLKENTVLKPDAKGKISLKINPKLKKECDLVLRDPSILND